MTMIILFVGCIVDCLSVFPYTHSILYSPFTVIYMHVKNYIVAIVQCL